MKGPHWLGLHRWVRLSCGPNTVVEHGKCTAHSRTWFAHERCATCGEERCVKEKSVGYTWTCVVCGVVTEVKR